MWACVFGGWLNWPHLAELESFYQTFYKKPDFSSPLLPVSLEEPQTKPRDVA